MPENESPSQPDDQKKTPDEKPADKPTEDTKKDSEPKTDKPKKGVSDSKRARAANKVKARGKSRRMSDEKRRELWKQAVIQKARKMKHFSEGIIIVALIAVLGLHALSFVRYEVNDTVWERRGYELAIDLVTPKTVDRYEDEQKRFYTKDVPIKTVDTIGTFPHVIYLKSVKTGEILMKGGQRAGRFDQERPASILAQLYLIVPIGAALLLLLYLLDYLVFFGRLLPAMSFAYGFGTVAYLMASRLPVEGTWNVFVEPYMPWWIWFLLWVPLFFVGFASMLRIIVSHRYKRYQFRGQPIPEHLKPHKPGEGDKAADKPEDKAEDKTEKSDDASAPKDASKDSTED